MGFSFTPRGKKADFGSLGDDASGDNSSDTSNDQNIDSQTEGSASGGGQQAAPGNAGAPASSAPKASDSSSGGLLDSLGKLATGGVGGSMGSLCGGAQKDSSATAAKQAELQQKYPLRDCGPTPTQECLAYNQSQLSKQQAELAAWQAAADAASAIPGRWCRGPLGGCRTRPRSGSAPGPRIPARAGRPCHWER